MIESCDHYRGIGAVFKEYQITYTESDFMIETAFNIPKDFREDLQTVMRKGVVDNSELAICENLIYPVLKEVWKRYSSKFTLWSHQSLICDNNLSGIPEYILAQRSPLGKVVFDKPYLLFVEAKQDKFNQGWGQCLTDMVVAQRLNEEPQMTIFGIVSIGEVWQFGKLEANVFTKNVTFYTIQELDQLFAAVNYVFQQCELQLANLLAT